MLKSRILSFTLSCTLFTSATMAEGKTYEAAITHFPPLFVVEEDKPLGGTVTNLLKATLDRAGLTYNLKGLPPKRLLRGLSKGEIDIIVGIKTATGFVPSVIYSEKPVTQIELRIYARKGTPIPDSVDELYGRNKVGLIRGYQYGDKRLYLTSPENVNNIVEMGSHEGALGMLQLGRVDYFLDYKLPIESTLQSKPIRPDIHYKSVSNVGMYFVVSNKLPNAAELMELLVENSLSLSEP